MNGRAFSANHRPYSSSYILPPNTSKWGKQSEGSVYGPDIVETVVISAPSHDKLLVAPLADPRSRESMRDPSFQLSLNETVDPPSPPQRINTSEAFHYNGEFTKLKNTDIHINNNTLFYLGIPFIDLSFGSTSVSDDQSIGHLTDGKIDRMDV